MSTHTPGPWVAAFDDAARVRDADGGGIAICTNLKANPIGRRDANEVEANARLIAAAPDLLAALEVLLADRIAYIEGGEHSGDDDPDTDHMVIQARAAIAKAQG